MKRLLTATLVLALAAVWVPVHAETDPEPTKAERLRALHAEFSKRVVVLSWRTTTSAMGQNVVSNQAATGVLVGDSGLFVVSNQVFNNDAAGMAGMFGGRGAAPTISDLHVNGVASEPVDARKAHEDTLLNLRWFGPKESHVEGVKFPETVEVPDLGEEVVIIGAHDSTLNHARFFRVARINAVIEAGRYYGLDGAIQDCLGALVVSMDGRVLGIIGQKRGEAEQAGGGGIGRIMGGLSDPSRALGNRVLMTPAVFAESMKQAEAAVKAEGFFSDGPTATPTRPTDVQPLFEGTVASANWREETKDVFVLIDVVSGEVPAMDGKVEVRNASGNTVAEVTITRHYRDPLDPQAPVDQVGGVVADPDQTLNIQRGWRVVVMPNAEAEPPRRIEFRGIERFRRVGPDLMESRFGGKAPAGFQVSQIPARESKTREAGVQNGDVIIKVGDTAVTEDMDLQSFLDLLMQQTGEVKLTIVRAGGEVVEITVAE